MTTLYGLIGEKLSHSISPTIHLELFKKLNMDADYKLFEIERSQLDTKFHDLKTRGVNGLNVTIPYKVETINFLDEISEQAKKIGAINTICFQNNKIIGHNTDYFGFGKMLHKNSIEIKGKTVVILGAGGAAKAVIQYLIDSNAKKIMLVSRDTNKAAKNFNGVEIIDYEQLQKINTGDAIINCTPVGMYPNVSNLPINENCITKFSVAVDLIYNPCETLFLKIAKKHELKAVNGLYMLVSQAIYSEELWNDIHVDKTVIDSIFNNLTISHLQKNNKSDALYDLEDGF